VEEQVKLGEEVLQESFTAEAAFEISRVVERILAVREWVRTG
jgi:hypothetical protein